MIEYAKPWLSVDEQVAKLQSRGVEVGERAHAADLLRMVGYYRLTGYLYPFRNSESYEDDEGRSQIRILNEYRPGTSLGHAAEVIDFDRKLRMLVLDGVERIEISMRMQIGYILGRVSPFAHRQTSTFISSFTDQYPDPQSNVMTSKHAEWLKRVDARRADSDEAFVAHFRTKYDDQIPIWALTEILEMGQLGRLYTGLINALATEIAQAYGAPTKKLMTSWISSLNYVRNVAAHHARLFNRKLVAAPGRPKEGTVPLLDHLRDETTPKAVFGLYNALAVMAYLLRSIDRHSGWPQRVVEVVQGFPEEPGFTVSTLGIPTGWTELELWHG
ncbi:Abi family protein [Specibacter cremeus]|uniref:Abi family protein n=1 Tax=Specibacter cremeus TaxID=1629051 RepID=UPI000F7ABDD7|nr:Abi family protein [Specibacter cremeus]